MDDFRTVFLNKSANFVKSTSPVGRKSRKLTTGCTTDLNPSRQFNKPRSTSTVLSPKSGDDESIDTVTEANDLLENGILVETDNGYYQCLSLKDALTSGIGGLNLSVEDLQNVAAQLLTAQKGPSPNEINVENVRDSTSVERIAVNSVPDVSLGHLMYCNDEGVLKQNVEQKPNSVEVQIEIAHVCDTNGTKNVALPNEETTLVDQFRISETGDLNSADTGVASVHPKKRGGWPKGRKRKPDLTDIQPPKAPATGYVLFLNEKRKEYKDLPFPEVTKLLGNEWSNLSLEEKKIYLDRADIEKKRYREELKAYRQSDAYQSYLNRKRIKKLQGNGTEESDMDATDEIEDEDNEELYCRTCDQWFSSLHNKKEHLYGRQHLQVIAGDFTREHLAEQDNGILSSSQSVSTSLDESSLDGLPLGVSKGTTRNRHDSSPGPANMAEAILRLMQTNAVRDREIKVLGCQLNEAKSKNAQLNNQLNELKGRQSKLMQDLEKEKVLKHVMEENICALWTVPSHYYIGPPQVENLPAPNLIFNRIS